MRVFCHNRIRPVLRSCHTYGNGFRGSDRQVASFDISGETLAKTTLSSLKTGSMVNIERAIAADGRFGGHFVLGHIDGTAKITKSKSKTNSQI